MKGIIRSEGDELSNLSFIKDYRVFQVSTHGHDRPITAVLSSWKPFTGTMHRDMVPIPPQESWEFPEITGPGKIVNFWFTAAPPIDFDIFSGKGVKVGDLLRNFTHLSQVFPYNKFWNLLKNVWLEIYFDGESTPSVKSPLGDFFGVGYGEYKHHISRYLMETSGGYVCQFPMPFHQRARVVLVNRNEKLWLPAFYGAVTFIRYENEAALDGQGYFHAQYREEFPTSADRPYLILDTQEMGKPDRAGHYVGVVLNTEGVDRKSGYMFLEGNTKIWVDGETEQSIEYTGLEDYYQAAWYYVKTKFRSGAEFDAPYHGLTVKSLNKMGMLGSMLFSSMKPMRLSQYRFHPEGIPFDKSIRVTVHHGEFDEIPSNFSSVAYWYQEH
jgi:hypothetical protein